MSKIRQQIDFKTMGRSEYLNKISIWDADAARHILSRSLFGFTQQDVDFALSKTLDDFVDNYLLKDQPEPAPPNYNGTDWTIQPHNSANQTNYTNWYYSLVFLWLNMMINQGFSFREKMVWFWSNHFVSESSTVQVPQFIYMQNKLFRRYALGNIIELTKKVTINPAMLIYLNGNQNTKSSPNENYARELMELFTIGIGNYSETDIKQAARALTGWRINNTTLTSYFDSPRFDSGTKTFLGQTGNFGYEDIVNIIFTKPAAAEFICRKLYKEFLYYQPNEDYVKQLAEIMRANNFNLNPVLSTLLKSQYFHSEDIRGAKIKSPIELLVAAVKQFGISTDNNFLNYIRTKSKDLQQEIFNPPDVRGWEGQRKWMSTTTYPSRNNYTDSIINGVKIGSITYRTDVVAYARSFSSSEKSVQFVEEVTKQLIQFPLSQARKDFLLATLLDGAAVYDWSTYDPQAKTRLEKFFKALMRLPEFQLS